MPGKNDIILAIAEALGISRQQAAEIFDAVWERIGALLAAGETVRLPGLGAFKISERSARRGRNPATGAAINVRASKNVRFKPVTTLKEALNSESRAAGDSAAGSGDRPGTRSIDLEIAESGAGAGDGYAEAFELAREPEPRAESGGSTRGGRGGRGHRDLAPALDEAASEPTAASAPPLAPAPAADPRPDREISARLAERPAGDDRPLEVDSVYHLDFQVGEPAAGNLLTGATRVGGDEVPPEGLDLEWVVHSREIELLPGLGVEVTVETIDGEPAWTAQFALAIPGAGESEVRTLGIVPRRAGDGRLDVLLRRERHDGSHNRRLREVYRQLALRLRVGEVGGIAAAGPAAAASEPSAPSAPVAIVGDATLAAGRHLNLRTPHEWATPPGELSITVGPGSAYVQGDVMSAAGVEARNQWTTWHAKPALVDGPMKNARDSAERFRARWEDYLDDVEPADLERRLKRNFVPYDWHALPEEADAAHRQAWDQVAVSAELRDLAFDGHALYQAFFPPGSELRGWLDGLPWGHRINVSWLPFGGADWVPHVPWGLMYRRPAPPLGTPVEPMDFLGLGFRLGYTSHQVAQPSKALGALGSSTPTFLLYWGSDAGDETAAEAAWQRARWGGWPKGLVVPAAGAAPSAAKQELLGALDAPGPSPATLLYLYCQASVGQGHDPVLRFGTDLTGQDEVRRTDLPQQPLSDGPLVFANACATGAAGAYMANLLEESFFQRGCRAFLGTETKVPIAFASRFAAVFFHFFSLRVPEPLAAGEAMALARLFLWCHYRNLGGILYSYVNQYELFLADDAEVLAMRA